MFRYSGSSPVITGLVLGILMAVLAFLNLLPGIRSVFLIVLGISVVILIVLTVLLASTSRCNDSNLRNCLCRFAQLIITASFGTVILALIMVALGEILFAVNIVLFVLVFLLFLFFGTALIAFVRFLICQIRAICGNSRFD